MSQHPEFRVDVYHNEYLSEGEREINAIITVTATGGGMVDQPAAEAAEVIILDCSGSMGYPQTKLAAAKQAAAVAIDTLRDGVMFAVIAGTHIARPVYPPDGMAPATETTRAQAKAAVARVRADGGTAMGEWLALTDRLLADRPDAIRHAILLTDGRNEHETPANLESALATCAGHFTCDCRGVGTDWEVSELRRIASTLLGTVDIIAQPADMAADFRALTAEAMSKVVADVALRLWTPRGATVRFLKQAAPSVADLTDRRVESGPRSGDYPTGSWGDESRDYHVCVEVSPAGIGEEMLAVRASLVLPAPDGQATVLAQGLVRAVWTADTALSTRISPQVAHYTGQAELADAIAQGLEARKAGDVDTATAKLGRAVELASELGREDTSKLLAKVVDVVDEKTGTVRLKAAVRDVDEMTLDTRSTKTLRVAKNAAKDSKN